MNLSLEPIIVSSFYQILNRKDIEVSSAIADPNVAVKASGTSLSLQDQV